MRTVPQGAARRGEAGGDRHARQVRRAGALARADADHPVARPVARVPGHPRDAHLPPGLPAAQSRREEQGVGGSETGDEEAAASHPEGRRVVILALLLAAGPVVHYAEFTGSVDPGSGAYLIAAIHGAQERGAEALVVRIDTPGGLLTTTRDIVQAELNAKVPIVFWRSEEHTSELQSLRHLVCRLL